MRKFDGGDFKKFSRWLLELENGTLMADIRSQLRDISEIPEPGIVKELFANTTSEDVVM